MPIDGRGIEIVIGDKVAVAAKLFVMDGLFVCERTVTRIEGDRVYLDGSTRPLKYPNRIMVLGR